MKHIIILLSAIILTSLTLSCADNKPAEKTAKQNKTYVKKNASVTLTDSLQRELEMAHKRSMELYSDEQFYKFVEYIYPRFFSYLSKKSHSRSAEVEKEKYVDQLLTRNEHYWEKIVSIISPNAVSYKFVFDKIKFVRKSGRNLLIIYSQRACYATPTETVNNPKLNYGYAIFLAGEKKWYFLDFETKHLGDMLKDDFDHISIAETIKEAKKLR